MADSVVLMIGAEDKMCGPVSWNVVGQLIRDIIISNGAPFFFCFLLVGLEARQ